MDRHGSDRWLVGIVIGTILLVVAALLVVLNRNDAVYIDDTIPAGVVHNYLLALQQKSYEQAYSYLSPTLPGYPASADVFYDEVHNKQGRFGEGNNQATAVRETDYFGEDHATVRVELTTFRSISLLGGSQSTSNFDFKLVRIDGSWKLADGGSYSYWHSCWSSADISCPNS